VILEGIVIVAGEWVWGWVCWVLLGFTWVGRRTLMANGFPRRIKT